jgi:hypothetical protein
MAGELKAGYTAGSTLTARVWQDNGASDFTQVGSDVSMTESTNAPGLYRGDMPATGAGRYWVQFLDSGALVPNATTMLDWDGTAVVSGETLRAAIASNTSTLSAIDNGLTEVAGTGFDSATDSLAALQAQGAAAGSSLSTILDYWADVSEDNAGTQRFTAAALALAPNDVGGDATEANQTSIINALTAMQGAGFVEANHSLEAIATGAFDPDTDTVANVATVTGNIGGNVTGSVGSIDGVTFPANFASLDINGSGHVVRVGLVDTVTTNSDMRGTDSALLASSFIPPDNAGIASNGAALAILDGEMALLAGSGFDTATDSLASIRARGDSAWTTFDPSNAVALSTASVAAVADAVWTEAVADHQGSAGSTAAALAAAGSSGDPWSTALPGAYGAGTAGQLLGFINQALADTTEDNAGTLRFTTAALGLAPVGGGGDATATNQATILANQGALASSLSAIADAAFDPTADLVTVGALQANVINDGALDASAITEIQGGINTYTTAAIAPLLDRLTATRAGYLDFLPKLDVSGTLAHTGTAATYRADLTSVVGDLTTVLDILQDVAEDDGGGTQRFTAAALALAPAAGSVPTIR